MVHPVTGDHEAFVHSILVFVAIAALLAFATEIALYQSCRFIDELSRLFVAIKPLFVGRMVRFIYPEMASRH